MLKKLYYYNNLINAIFSEKIHQHIVILKIKQTTLKAYHEI